MLWHHRLGHVGEATLLKMAKLKLISLDGAGKEKQLGFCESCPHGKSHAQPSSGGHLPGPDSEEDVVFLDIWGPARTPSAVGNKRFAFGFLHSRSRKCRVYFAVYKSEAPGILQQLLEYDGSTPR